MANEDKNESKINKKRVNSLVNLIQNNMQKIYRSTYFTQDTNKSDLDLLKSNIDSSIDKIMNNNLNNVGIPNISRLYARFKDPENKNNKITDEMEKLFEDKSLTDGLLFSIYNDNKYIKDIDEEIDVICKYMPQLEDALDAKKDNVLAADHFSKDFITVVNDSNVNVEASFLDRIKEIKKKYNLLETFENMYDNAARYGEDFIYVVPYKKALNKLLQNKPQANYSGGLNNVVSESVLLECFNENKINITYDFNNKKIISENGMLDIAKELSGLGDKEEQQGELKVELNRTGILESAILEYSTATKIINKQSTGKIIDDNISFEGLKGQESIINQDTKNNKEEQVTIDIPGCIIKSLPRENVIPIYIDNLCLGYYYIEYNGPDPFKDSKMIDPLLSFKHKNTMFDSQLDKKDETLKFISSKLSKFIDSKFINANQDLAKEIYMILRHNDIMNSRQTSQFKITFIPPEDMHHIYFQKDQKTHRGVSDLDKAMLPAKLYTSLYVNNTIGYLTRGFDKRVYYVKQNVETNISQSLLNTINQIKKSNFGARELTNIKTILNMTGRNNDYVIPMNAAGEAPIQFEVMPGQNIEVKTELMAQLEQMAINSTDVPYEYIQSRQNVDYAVRLTQASGKFLRKAFKRQAKIEIPFSDIVTIIYNCEYQENDNLQVTLPPPAFLNMINSQQMIQNTNEYVENIVETEASDKDDTFKNRFRKKLKRSYLSTYIDYDMVDKIKEQTGMELEKEKNKSDTNQM